MGDPAAQARWSPWTAPAALLSGVALAAVGALVVDIPAAALGVKITSSHVPPGVVIADTAVQDVAFVAVAVFFAQLGGHTVRAWELGLRPTRLWRAVWLVVALLLAFLVLNVIGSESGTVPLFTVFVPALCAPCVQALFV